VRYTDLDIASEDPSADPFNQSSAMQCGNILIEYQTETQVCVEKWQPLPRLHATPIMS